MMLNKSGGIGVPFVQALNVISLFERSAERCRHELARGLFLVRELSG